MLRTVEYYESRINKLSEKDPVANRGIIRKLERALRKIKTEQETSNGNS